VPTPGLHLHPTADIAPRALLPGDPGRALALAQVLLDTPRMCNHHRGLWGYTGTAADGDALTIQATGMGGPSAAIVLEELADLGVELAVRVGTATALDPALAPGALLGVTAALADDGTSRALGASGRLEGDAGLAAALAAAAGRAGVVASTDLFYPGAADATARAAAWRAAGAAAVDLETAALLAVAGRRGIRAGSLLAVAATADGRHLDADGAAAAGLALGAAAGRALGLPESADDAAPATAPGSGEAA
jgi:uridine phosphorylase